MVSKIETFIELLIAFLQFATEAIKWMHSLPPLC